MAQRIALGFLLDKILKDVTKNVNQEHKSKIESDVDKRLISIFGNDWSKLPITGPRMMAMVFVLNIVLLPFGIVPATLIEIAIKKSKEYGVEDRFVHLLANVKLGTEDSKEKLQELMEYAGEAGKSAKSRLATLSDDATDAVTKVYTKSKNMFGKLSSKDKNKL